MQPRKNRVQLAPMVAAVIFSAGAVAGCSSKESGAVQTSSGAGSGASGTVVGTTGSTSGISGGGSVAGNPGSSGAGASGALTGTSGVSGPTSGSTPSSGSSVAGEPEGGEDATVGSGDDGSEGQPDSGLVEAFDAAGRTPPTCAKVTPPPNDVGGAQGSRPSECDYLLQSLDFEDMYSYPSSTAVKVSGAFGLSQVNNCSPYCYAKNLTVGIDIVGGGTADQLQGDIIVEFAATGPGLPITVVDATQANTRDALAWITFDGAAAPPFEIDTQLIVETGGSVIVPAVEVKAFFKTKNLSPFGPFSVANNYSYGNGCEFKYFPFTSATGFPNALMNVTGMGFRIVAKATAGQSWHGVAYIDHMHIRLPAAADMPAGNYPFGLE